MDRNQAIDALPAPYGAVIRLLDEGEPPDRVARLLGLEPETARTLAAVATGKLTELLARSTAGIGGGNR